MYSERNPGSTSSSNGRPVAVMGDVTHTLTADGSDGSEDGPGRGTPIIAGGSAVVRRLTPLECERLQAFPDRWTDVAGQTDSPRYRQMGNAVTVSTVEWIARRLVAVEDGVA